MALDLRSLIGKLGDTTRRSLEGAAGLCMSRTHYEVEIEHWFAKLLETPGTDFDRALRHFDVSPDHLINAIDRELGAYRTGNANRPDLSEDIESLARDAWVIGSINHGLAKIRSGAVLLAALSDTRMRRRLIDIDPQLKQVNVEAFENDFETILADSSEASEVMTMSAAPARDVGGTEGAAGGPTPALDQFTIDLTADAASGKIDAIVGRDPEIRQIIDILMRRRQNNPILTGEAGVGKTAVVEGFALRIAAGDVPEPLQGVALRSLDLGLLQAGAGVKGEFENRLKQVIEEVRSSVQPIIMFIDEAHTLIGAGGAEGQNDAANLLKPALARGELRTIAATTWAEYKKYFEKDPALTRRFQVVKVEEPSEDVAIGMMRGIQGKLQEHHGVQILDEAVAESVRLSSRYIPARQLPDKSVSVLDTACAKVSIGQQAIPASIEDLRRKIDALGLEMDSLAKEKAVGQDHSSRIEELEQTRASARSELEGLEQRWESEKQLVSELREIRTEILAAEESGDASTSSALRDKHESKKQELATLQGEDPLVLVDVDGQAIAEVISSWTGIPVGKMVADEINTILDLENQLGQRVIGQDHALKAIAKRIHTSRANLDNPSRPIGVFLLAGPSGVGKTETGLALSDTLYGGERNIITINMSEYQEAHTVSSLKGSPPGYVGYGEGGVLTEAVRRRPHAVVLLDEVEKAHPDVMEMFFQVFDKGVLEDGEGREIDFRNTIILLTSNVGSDTIMQLCADPDTRPEPEALVEAIRPELLKVFPAALIGRMVPTCYFPISDEMLQRIIELQLGRIKDRIAENHQADFQFDQALISEISKRCNDAESGARTVDRILTHALLPEISAEFLGRMARGEDFSKVAVSVDENGAFVFEVS